MTDDPPVPSSADRVKAAVAALEAQGAPPEAIHAYLAQQATPTPARDGPGVISRAAAQLGGMVKQVVFHPIDTAVGMAKSIGSNAIDAVLTPEAGESRPALATIANSKGGNSAHITAAHAAQPYDAEHGAQPVGGRTTAGLNTAATAAFPAIARGGSLLRLAAAGGVSGAAGSPDDPMAGALAGAAGSSLLGGIVKGGGKLAEAGESGASRLMDMAGRPADTRPAVTIPVLNKGVGSIEGLPQRAARLNAKSMGDVTVPETTKPLTPIEAGGTPAVRLARGLKTASPAAETVFRDALEPRAEGAVDRVIQHGLETTGLTNRESGLSTVDDLIAQRTQHGRENFEPTFAKYDQPIDDARLSKIAATPAGKLALKRGATIAANRGENIGEAATGGVPPGFSPEQWQKVTEAMTARGEPIPDIPGAETKIAPTLRQAHYVKLGFDDMLNSAPEPGSGGSGPNNAAAIRALKNQWLGVLDEHAPEYAQNRKTFADESDLIRAGELGRTLFKLHPDEAAKAFGEMSEAERQVARRTGFDALAERVENGPQDVNRGLKVRDQKRMRLLFPDDASFETFKQGLQQEAQMHATNQTVLGGSPTAEKLADMAGIAGVTIPEVMHAATGRFGPMVKGMAGRGINALSRGNLDKLSVERAKLLTAGADGNAAARAEALRKVVRVRP